MAIFVGSVGCKGDLGMDSQADIALVLLAINKTPTERFYYGCHGYKENIKGPSPPY